jgi:hypothetical protein
MKPSVSVCLLRTHPHNYLRTHIHRNTNTDTQTHKTLVLTDHRYLRGITFTHFAQSGNKKAEHIASAVEASLSAAYLTTLSVTHNIASNNRILSHNLRTETEENYDESHNSRCPSKDLDREPPNTS